jgi:hypothetical protein
MAPLIQGEDANGRKACLSSFQVPFWPVYDRMAGLVVTEFNEINDLKVSSLQIHGRFMAGLPINGSMDGHRPLKPAFLPQTADVQS